MQKPAKEWLAFARRDRRAASKLIQHDDLLSIAAFHCQPAIEKAYKAILELNDQRTARAHDLVTLHNQAQPFLEVPVEESDLGIATDVYLTTRYPVADSPDGNTQPSRKRVENLLDCATRVCDFIEKQLGISG